MVEFKEWSLQVKHELETHNPVKTAPALEEKKKDLVGLSGL